MSALSARAQRPGRLGWRELHAGSLATRRRRWRNHRGGRAAPLTALTPAAPKGASILASRPAPCYAAGCDAQRGAAQHKAYSHHRREGLQRRFARASYSWHMHHLTRHDTPGAGNHSIPAPLDIRLTNFSRRTPDKPSICCATLRRRRASTTTLPRISIPPSTLITSAMALALPTTRRRI